MRHLGRDARNTAGMRGELPMNAWNVWFHKWTINAKLFPLRCLDPSPLLCRVDSLPARRTLCARVLFTTYNGIMGVDEWYRRPWSTAFNYIVCTSQCDCNRSTLRSWRWAGRCIINLITFITCNYLYSWMKFLTNDQGAVRLNKYWLSILRECKV